MENHHAAAICTELRLHPMFADLPVSGYPNQDLWKALDQTLELLRLPLHYRYLRKKAPSVTQVKHACEHGLALMTAFARVFDVRQIVVSCRYGWPSSVSCQPRPLGLNWTAEHAIVPSELRASISPDRRMRFVDLPDFAFMAAHVAHAAGGYQEGDCPDLTATYQFSDFGARVVVRETSGVYKEMALPFLVTA